jgi:hypothetical protein
MQFVEYRLKKYFEPLKHYLENPRWRQNSKKNIFAAKWAIFNGFQNLSTQRCFKDTINVNKTQESFLKSVENWLFGRKKKFF